MRLLLPLIALVFSTSASAQSLWDFEPEQVRHLINEKLMNIAAEKPVVENVLDITISNHERATPLRIYQPNKCEFLPIILLIHGGAWIAGNLDTHDNLARYLCRESQALVVSVGYLNSPEGKFPLPLEQCYDALLWTVEHAEELRADPNQLAIVGDSAGGNMTAALCLIARDRSGPKIDLQVLINPVTDFTQLRTLERQDDEFDRARWFVIQYLANPEELNHPYASPIKAVDLSGLPPALVLLAEHDLLRTDGERYAKRLTESGIPTNTYTQWGVEHLAGHAARASVVGQESLNIAAAALRGAFYRKRKMEHPYCPVRDGCPCSIE